jgi:hypothetical protein
MKILMLLALFIGSAQASIVGMSSHPYELNQHIFRSELATGFSSGNGTGLEVSYLGTPIDSLNIDAGFAVSSGDQENRLFAGATYEIFPDYESQPKISAKAFIDRNKFEDDTVYGLGFAPIASKGLNMGSLEVFPYASLPLKINREGSYTELASSLGFGMTAPITNNSERSVTANFETNINMRNSYTGVALGIGIAL